MEKIVIRENNVLAVETRSGLFVIAQALKHHKLVFFKLFTTTPLFFNADLNHAEYLCCVTPVKSFFKRAKILKLKIPPASDMEHYSRQNHLALDLTDYRLETFIAYAGTKDEIMIPYIPVGGFLLVDWKHQTLQHLSKEKDIDIINEHQFEPDERLNEIPGAVFDQEEKVIYGMTRGSASEHTYFAYRYEGQKIMGTERLD